MKKIFISVVLIVAVVLPLISGCQGGERTSLTNGALPTSVATEAPDDIVHTPGGDAYRANVHQVGEPDKWPSIQSVDVVLGSLNINYRRNIETKAGETRNNIISVYKEGGLIDSELALYSVAVSEGVGLNDVGGGGRFGMLLTVLAIAISAGVATGEYTFQIGIEIDSKDYGTIPCTVSVIE